MDRKEISSPAYWAERYRQGDDGWDLGDASPVLQALLDSERAPPRGRYAVPGCGWGHDVRLLLDRGYDAIGFDFAVSPPGIPHERCDVFELGTRYPEAFEGVVEYTCYCAIEPSRRDEYAGVLRRILRPGGTLVALVFPLEERDGGPPFGIRESEIRDVLGRGLELIHLEESPHTPEARRGREKLALFRKPAARRPRFHDVCDVADVPGGGGRRFVVAGEPVALFRTGDGLFALHDECPHRGGPLSEGAVEGGVVTCPWHGWRFDLASGVSPLIPNQKVPCFEVRVEGERVLVRV